MGVCWGCGVGVGTVWEWGMVWWGYGLSIWWGCMVRYGAGSGVL